MALQISMKRCELISRFVYISYFIFLNYGQNTRHKKFNSQQRKQKLLFLIETYYLDQINQTAEFRVYILLGRGIIGFTNRTDVSQTKMPTFAILVYGTTL